jgi:hypothetical protein
VRAALATYLQEGLRAEYPDANIEVAAFTWDWLSFPPYGDESAAMRMSFTINVGSQSLVFHSDLIGWRVGRVEASLTFDSRTQVPDPQEEQRLAQIIEARLRQAAEELD